MSQLFGVKVDTAYRICIMGKYQAKKRGGSRGKKLNDTHFQFLIVKVESRPDITINELKEQLSLKGVHISVSTIARCLEGKLITYYEKLKLKGRELRLPRLPSWLRPCMHVATY